MDSTSRRVDIKNLNEKNFMLWKLKVEDMLIDQDLWVVMFGNKPLGVKQEDWGLEVQKGKEIIRPSLENSILLIIHKEKTTYSLWKKLGDIYQGKSLVNRLFLRNKLYSLNMDEGMTMQDHLNSFNVVIAQLASVGMFVGEEEWCMLLLCFFPNLWDDLVMAIKRTTT